MFRCLGCARARRTWARLSPRLASLCALAAALTLVFSAPALAQTAADAESGAVTTAPEVEVIAPRLVTPLPGLMFDREQITTNVQSATGQQIQASGAVTITDFMNRSMQSVTTNDYQGNPFQQQLNFRGFSASPEVGMAQGLSVYLDGVRVNEPFGEVVNWDLIPMNAISRMDLLPGSNPLFGLNTLGGALAISTKNGFTDPGIDATVLGGSWNRRQVQASIGGNNGAIGGFLAVNGLDEDGWRDDSPSHIRQLFANTTVRGSAGDVGVTLIYADNSLVGNGVVPVEMYEQRPSAVFTSPDETDNRLLHLAINGRLDLSDTTSLSAMAYQRQVHQTSTSGDFYDEWDQEANGRTGFCPNMATSTFPDGAAEVNATGCPGVAPNGVFNYGVTDETAKGLTLQYNWTADKHQLVLGSSYDSSDLTFSQDQRLGWIGPNGQVYLDPASYKQLHLIPLVQDIHRNSLVGSSSTASLFALGVWNVKPTLNFTAGGRYNYSRVRNDLESDRPVPLYQFDTNYLLNHKSRCGVENNDPVARYYCSHGDFKYESFNPYIGLSWLPTPAFNWFASASQGARVPSAIELGCARDHALEARFAGQNNGKLRGCSIPTGLTSDPYLPQVRSTSVETGIRGQFGSSNIGYNAAVYRTDLTDDILFVSVGSRDRGVFDTFGQTRRQGVELGLDGHFGHHTFRAAYSFLDATFQSPATIVNPANSSSNHAQGQLSTFNIEPGDRIPGLPQHSVRLAWDYSYRRWNLGLSMIANSWSYARGNENNESQPGGTSSNGTLLVNRQGQTVVDPGRAYVGSGRVPGYAIFNLTASYHVGRDWMVFMRADNLFDRQYQTAAELGLNPFAPSRWGVRDAAGFNYNSNDWTYSNFIGPGAPRAIWVGINYSFSPPRPGSR